MMRLAQIGALAAVIAVLAACNPPSEQAPPGEPVPFPGLQEEENPAALAPLPEVDAALLAAPNTEFVAVEPSQMDIFGAATVREAIAGLTSPEALGEGETLQLSVRETGDRTVADIVRGNMQDDSIASGHVRVEFRREAEGWFPVNAFRRNQCRRGAQPMQWTSGICP